MTDALYCDSCGEPDETVIEEDAGYVCDGCMNGMTVVIRHHAIYRTLRNSVLLPDEAVLLDISDAGA